MDIEEFTKERLEKSAADAKIFWDSVKSRLSKPLGSKENDLIQLIDIHHVSDDSMDLIMLRKNGDTSNNQLEHCRIVAESRGLFKKPRIVVHFTSGPLENE